MEIPGPVSREIPWKCRNIDDHRPGAAIPQKNIGLNPIIIFFLSIRRANSAHRGLWCASRCSSWARRGLIYFSTGEEIFFWFCFCFCSALSQVVAPHPRLSVRASLWATISAAGGQFREDTATELMLMWWGRTDLLQPACGQRWWGWCVDTDALLYLRKKKCL